MTISEGRTRRQQAPRSFALDVLLTGRSGGGDKFLRHAENHGEAIRMAGRVTGPARGVLAFDDYPLALPILGRSDAGEEAFAARLAALPA
jgi:hypothetical protein